jgi:hypothetical protein
MVVRGSTGECTEIFSKSYAGCNKSRIASSTATIRPTMNNTVCLAAFIRDGQHNSETSRLPRALQVPCQSSLAEPATCRTSRQRAAFMTRFQPRQGFGLFIGGELPNLCRNKVLRNVRQDPEEFTVGHRSYTRHLSMMISHELEMRHKRREAVPAGKGVCAYQQAGQLSILRDEESRDADGLPGQARQ